ncbi:hypothetical protein BDV95DRAFT_105028 [Massariosphaeria phaeospora]|uniref:Uncharacterized protein n=1 Tax=Massariosphaeria phaeospora TaxID=100035 RepID=A0A7C8MHG9_9PLEO|nr:hypothetical protein BDV95DRAFT_105028 [Massariosphaeria phaeospora]
MITAPRCWYAYKWRGRYYFHRSNFGEYDSNGYEVTNTIPSGPKKFKAWLESKRAQYTWLEAELEKSCFSISTEDFLGKNVDVFATLQARKLRSFPSFCAEPGSM